MTKLGAKTITGLYIGISAVACYLFLHAALTNQQLALSRSTTKPTSVAVQQPSATGNGGSSTTTPAPSGSSSTSQSGSGSSATSGSGNLASQQYNQTSNWAGYATTGSIYSAITGSWDVPTVSASDETAADATWIGIGGITGNDLIQVGTQNVVSPDGTVSTSAFYEMLPDASVDIPSVNINPGDAISASIHEVSSGEWSITLSDSTNGESFTTDVAYNSTESSAEWIEEDPSDGTDQQIPLDSFGTVDFTDGTTTDNGSVVSITSSGAQSVAMINDADQSLADVSTLSTNGESFSVTRTSTTAGSSITEFNNDPEGWTRRGSGMGFGGFGGFDGSDPEGGYGF
jgi:hypothetical protein